MLMYIVNNWSLYNMGANKKLFSDITSSGKIRKRFDYAKSAREFIINMEWDKIEEIAKAPTCLDKPKANPNHLTNMFGL